MFSEGMCDGNAVGTLRLLLRRSFLFFFSVTAPAGWSCEDVSQSANTQLLLLSLHAAAGLTGGVSGYAAAERA